MQTTPTTTSFQNFRRGDTQALGELLDRLRPYVRVIVRSVMRGRSELVADESDLIQESLMQASQCSHTFHGESEAEWLGWLRTITVRTTGRILRSRNHGSIAPTPDAEMGTVIVDPSPAPAMNAIRQETADRMALVMTRLPEEMQQVLLARVVDGTSYETIAENLNRSPGAVRILFVRALRRLREVWQTESSSSSGVSL
jgi:RNA polymerase sigma-70 factor (ECF subfamily)